MCAGVVIVDFGAYIDFGICDAGACIAVVSCVVVVGGVEVVDVGDVVYTADAGIAAGVLVICVCVLSVGVFIADVAVVICCVPMLFDMTSDNFDGVRCSLLYLCCW